VSALSDVARSWIRAINSRDPDATVALITPDFELVESSTLPGAARAVGADGLRRYIAGWGRNWSDWEMREVELTEVPPAHAVLVADLRLRGLQSGIDVSRRWTYLLTIRGDKLAAQIGYDDVDAAISAANNQLPG
jgi:ketosteroid isomerase-like protein